MSVEPAQDNAGCSAPQPPEYSQPPAYAPQPAGYAGQPAEYAMQPAQPVGPQFVQQTQVTVVQQQPTVTNHLLIGSVGGHREWTTGLFGCFDDCLIACKVMHCYPCVVCDIANRTGECCCLPCIMPDALIPMRTRIRTLGGIRGSIFNDLCALTCCHSCAVCQMAREINAMGL